MKQWFILHTYSGHEKKVCESLKARVSGTDRQDAGAVPPLPGQDVASQERSGSQMHFIRIDKLLKAAGLVDSGADAQRQIKQKAVRISGGVIQGFTYQTSIPISVPVQVGRKIKQVELR